MNAQPYFEIIDMSESKASVARDAASGKALYQEKVWMRLVRSRAALAVFARAPQRGRVKTRLAKTRGEKVALQLHLAMLRDTLAISRHAMRVVRGETILFFTPPDACDFLSSAREYSQEKSPSRVAPHTRRALSNAKITAGKFARHDARPLFAALQKTAHSTATEDAAHRETAREYSLRALWGGATLPQSGGDLGKKMRDCCDELRSRGAKRTVIIGCDIPDLPPEIISAAFNALEKYDLVFGPAHDGGFYLIGASRRFSRALFSGVRWSRADVLTRVLANARRGKLRVFLLPEWRDVDDVSDLRALKKRLRARR